MKVDSGNILILISYQYAKNIIDDCVILTQHVYYLFKLNTEIRRTWPSFVFTSLWLKLKFYQMTQNDAWLIDQIILKNMPNTNMLKCNMAYITENKDWD